MDRTGPDAFQNFRVRVGYSRESADVDFDCFAEPPECQDYRPRAVFVEFRMDQRRVTFPKMTIARTPTDPPTAPGVGITIC